MAVYQRVKYFVQRQEIVLRALRYLRPEFVLYNRGMVSLAVAWPTFKRVEQVGIWGEWHYFLHGRGCRLTHMDTGERLEWDLGSLLRFDKSWFVNHLEWQATHQPNTEVDLIIEAFHKSPFNNGRLAEFMSPLLEELVAQNLLIPQGFRYILMVNN